jgi:hypothetical protein
VVVVVVVVVDHKSDEHHTPFERRNNHHQCGQKPLLSGRWAEEALQPAGSCELIAQYRNV